MILFTTHTHTLSLSLTHTHTYTRLLRKSNNNKDWDTFISLGYGQNDIHYLPEETVNSYLLGDPILPISEEDGVR